MIKALDGIKVLEMAPLGPGKYAGMILADLGADIIAMDSKDRIANDQKKTTQYPCRWNMNDIYNLTAESYNRNKRNIVLNIKNTDGLEVFHDLSSKADIIIEGFRPGVTERLKVDYETVKSYNPRIIYCSISGYGQSGPYKTLPGHDINYISMSGAISTIGKQDEPPICPNNYLADWAGGSLNAVIGILSALFWRERSGKGQYIDISMTDGVLSLISSAVYDYLNNNKKWNRGDAPFNNGFPYSNVYETKDKKYISIATVEPIFWERLCNLLGIPYFIEFEYAEGEKRQQILDELKKIFLTKTREEWFNLLKNNDICVGKVYELDELEDDPQIKHREMIVQIEHPKRGTVKQVGTAIRLSETPCHLNRLPVALPGMHTLQILKELKINDSRIKKLCEEGTVWQR